MKKFIPAQKRSDPIPLTFLKDDNTTASLSEWRGKVVLLNFWATWCSPCIREMPSLQKLNNLLSKESFAVLALSQDMQGWRKIRPFIQKYQLNDLPIYNDPKLSGAKRFAVKGLPTTILLDRDGREIGRLLGHAEWDSEEALNLIKYHLSNYWLSSGYGAFSGVVIKPAPCFSPEPARLHILRQQGAGSVFTIA